MRNNHTVTVLDSEGLMHSRKSALEFLRYTKKPSVRKKSAPRTSESSPALIRRVKNVRSGMDICAESVLGKQQHDAKSRRDG